jgi:hypothetical protein
MLAVPGLYEDGKITLLEPIPHLQRARVIITVLEDWPLLTQNGGNKPGARSWLGAYQHTAQIVGDIVEPLEDTWKDWEVLQN